MISSIKIKPSYINAHYPDAYSLSTAKPGYSHCKNLNTKNDSFQTSNSKFIVGNGYHFQKEGNVIKVVSFLGKSRFSEDEKDLELDNPKFKMKVAAVSRFQDNIAEITDKDIKINPKVTFEFDEDKREIKLIYEKTQKQIGFIDYDILDHLYDEMRQNPDDYELELTNAIKVPQGKNIGLQARINYVGKERERIDKLFENLFEDPRCAPIVYPPAKAASPESILKIILKYEEQLNGSQSKKDMDFVINNIANEIKSKKNKNILLLGHKEPDGDCIACMLGMQNAIELMDKTKKVDCAIDDNIPMLFDFIPNVKKIKRPQNDSSTDSLRTAANNSLASGRVDPTILERIRNYAEKNVQFLKKKEKYDLVILMDVAAPSRLGNGFAKYIDTDKTKIIFIDHHPKRFDEWEENKNKTKIDVKKADTEKLAWVADRVPAAAIMVSSLAGKLYPQLNDLNVYKKSTPEERTKLENMATAILTGVQTDTSGYSRSANLYTEDIKLPRYEKPKYNPAGLAKWYSLVTNRNVTRSFIGASFDAQNAKIEATKKVANQTLMSKCHRNDDLQLNYMKIEKEYLDNLWMEAAKNNPGITSKDVMGIIKFSKAFRQLKRVDTQGKAREGVYDDTIAYTMVQASKKGELGISQKIAESDNISFSFRSKNGTNHAAILASLFDGGGHGAAAGGRISGNNINFDTKFLVLVNGKVENDPEMILEALNKNFELEHSSMDEKEKDKLQKNVKVIKSPDGTEGKTIPDLIEAVVGKIRKNSAEYQAGARLLQI